MIPAYGWRVTMNTYKPMKPSVKRRKADRRSLLSDILNINAHNQKRPQHKRGNQADAEQ